MQEELKNPFIVDNDKALLNRCYKAYVNAVTNGGYDPLGSAIYISLSANVKINKVWKAPILKCQSRITA
jgi:hypothetical protein